MEPLQEIHVTLWHEDANGQWMVVIEGAPERYPVALIEEMVANALIEAQACTPAE